MKNNHFKEKLKIALDSNDITISELSRRTGIQRRRIYDYLDGSRSPDFKNAKILANVLNFSLNEKQIYVPSNEILEDLSDVNNMSENEKWEDVFKHLEKLNQIQSQCLSMVNLNAANDIIILLAKTTQEVQRMTYKNMHDQNTDDE